MLNARMAFTAFVQPCYEIPFYSERSTEIKQYDGFAIVPTNGLTDFNAIADSLGRCIRKLSLLKSFAPDPHAQEKYVRTINWLKRLHSSWGTAISNRDYVLATKK